MMSTSLCHCVCLSVCEYISRTTCTIFTNFCVHVAYGRGSVLLWQGDEIPRGRGNFGGCLGHSKVLAIFDAAAAAAFASKEIIQSPITSCRREEIIQYARQAQIGIRKILSAGDAAYRPGRECTADAKSDIYDCFVLSLCSSLQLWLEYFSKDNHSGWSAE